MGDSIVHCNEISFAFWSLTEIKFSGRKVINYRVDSICFICSGDNALSSVVVKIFDGEMRVVHVSGVSGQPRNKKS